MTIARDQTNWAAHLYVYLAILSLGLTTLYLALTGTEDEAQEATDKDESGETPRGEHH
jgi:hypothetical protein